jgi:hypothetical protein
MVWELRIRDERGKTKDERVKKKDERGNEDVGCLK